MVDQTRAKKEKLQQRLEKELEKYAINQATVQELIARQESTTRQKLAIVFIYGYLFLLFVILVGIPIFNYSVSANLQQDRLLLDLKDILQSFATVTGPIIGFVFGYYFKTGSDN